MDWGVWAWIYFCTFAPACQNFFSDLPSCRRIINKLLYSFLWGQAMVQLVQTLHYMSEGRGFDSRWYHWNFLLTWSFRPRYGSGVDSASNRKENQEYFLGGKGGRCGRTDNLTTFMCRMSWNMGDSTSWNPLACPGLQWDCFTFFYSFRCLTGWKFSLLHFYLPRPQPKCYSVPALCFF
jgi:hypothetical protein